jgi:putative SOS response-associated peptidase YedK
VLQEEDLARWLDPTAKPVDLQALMRPLGDSALDAYPVGKSVGNVRNDVPALLESIDGTH